MAIDLNSSLAWKTANREQIKLLDDLQGNILDGHGRKSTRHLFLLFDDAAKGRAFVHDLNALVTSAHQQLIDAQAFRDHGTSGPPFVGFLLSAAGYAALGVPAKSPADGGAFDQGMLARRAILNDPATSDWRSLTGRSCTP